MTILNLPHIYSKKYIPQSLLFLKEEAVKEYGTEFMLDFTLSCESDSWSFGRD